AMDPKERERQERAVGLHEGMAEGQKWFAEALNGGGGGGGRGYSGERGIGQSGLHKFGIGFAPDARGKLKAALKKLGEDKLIDCGLLIQPEEGGKDSYDRFRGRVMIPIRDQLVGGIG